MEEKNIKKLEKLPLPQIELPSHREELKRFLLERYFFEKRKQKNVLLFRKIAFCGISLVFLIFFTFAFVYPHYTLAKAKRIALSNPQVKELIKKGGRLKEVKIHEKEGYVLIAPPEKRFFKEDSKKIIGVLVKVDLKNKNIAKIEKISPNYFIGEKEIEKAKEIIHHLRESEKETPLILKIKESPLELRLIKEKEKVRVSPVQRKIDVIYKAGEKIWEGKINLDQEMLEVAKPLEE